MSPSSPAFDLDGFLALQQPRVERVLETRSARLLADAPERLREAMRYSLLGGGKRLRPVLCLAFADAVAGASNGGGDAADDAAYALESVHTYSLIHDDLPAMDDDDLRRGQPTNHKVYGEALAILAGDALLTDAFAVLAAGAVADAPLRVRLVAELAQAAGSTGMVGGQVLDIAPERAAERAYLERLHGLKTGALLRAACVMGALCGGGSSATVQAARTYGEAMGLAFQIADDVLDVTSTAEAMGKPTGADAASGRHTFPSVLGLAEAKALAQALAQRAVEAVAALEPSPGPLAALARYAVERRA